MNPKLQRAQEILRQLHVLRFVEQIRYLHKKSKNKKKNMEFIKENPGFVLPPEYLVFDANGRVDWWSYKETGLDDAKRITNELKELNLLNIQSLLEWGCGPGRVIRHMPDLLKKTELFGSDYNSESIEWCNKNFSSIKFVKNELNPPLSFDNNSFDFIYAISVFTHLSEIKCFEWINELSRILKPGGIIMVWTNGDVISKRILPEEKQKYLSGKFVVRDKYEEGKKMFLSFHPPIWVKNNLLKDFEIIKNLSGGFSGTSQDVWIARIRK